MELVCIPIMILVLFNITVRGNPDCDTHTIKGCKYCVQQPSWWDNCRWCDLDERCHATGSIAPYNDCNAHLVITDVRNCPEPRVYENYIPGNAYKLLKLSAVSYADDRISADKCLNLLGMNEFEIVELIGRHCEDLTFLAYRLCLVTIMISHKSKAIVLAYRGTTEFTQFLDEIQSVLFSIKERADIGYGEVQQYFKDAENRIHPCTVISLDELMTKYPSYQIWITGHSLGGALASIASARLIYNQLIKDEKVRLYTFGMPKVGDRNYADEHNKLVSNSWRVVHRDDPVPHYPISTGLSNGPFHHRTEVFYPYSRMLDSNYVICPGSDNDDCGSEFPLLGDIDDHKIYFDIPVGTYCESYIGRKRRSVKSAMWDHFNNKTCRRIQNSDVSTNQISDVNGATIHNGYVRIITVFILITRVLFG